MMRGHYAYYGISVAEQVRLPWLLDDVTALRVALVGGLMSQQHFPADAAEHASFGKRLALLTPPLAALPYPFFLEAFHVSIAPVISGRTAEPAWDGCDGLFPPQELRYGRSPSAVPVIG